MAKALPRGVREKNGSYEARAVVNGIRINLYGTDLNELMEEFEKAKKMPGIHWIIEKQESH